MIAPKHERSTSDVVQLAWQKMSAIDGNVRSILYLADPERTLRGKTQYRYSDVKSNRDKRLIAVFFDVEKTLSNLT